MAEATTGQKQLLIGLFVVAFSIALVGFAVVWFLAGGG
jgi:hypothetical protein